jgi:hypothetical protein
LQNYHPIVASSNEKGWSWLFVTKSGFSFGGATKRLQHQRIEHPDTPELPWPNPHVIRTVLTRRIHPDEEGLESCIVEDEFHRSIYTDCRNPTSHSDEKFSNHSHSSTHTDVANHLDIFPCPIVALGRMHHDLWQHRVHVHGWHERGVKLQRMGVGQLDP